MRNLSADGSGEQNNSHEFGEFRFDSGKRVLWRNGDLVYLPPKSADLLNVLLERRGEVLERSELIDLVWKDTFVEEGNLSYTISRLRKALGPDANGEDFIQTIPRRGYRFVGEASTNGNARFVIEKHSLTETVIDEIRTSDTGLIRAVGSRGGIVALSLVAILIAGAALAMTWRSGRSPSPAAPSAVKTIAVLPFRSAASDSEHRGLGLADIVITRLSGISGITVRPTSAVMAYENQEADAVKAGNDLQADAVIDGMIHRTGDTVHVTARLIRTADGTSLWSAVFEKPLSEEMSIERDLVGQLANVLSLNDASAQALGRGRPYTNNLDAYQLYVRGRYEWNKRDQHGLREGRHLFRSAIAVDPNFALAYVGLADSLVLDSADQEVYDAIAKALELDPDLGEAYATNGFVLAVHHWNWKEAEENFKIAIKLSPGYATAHHWYAILLGIEGRNDEAEAEMKRALEINPLSANFLADLGEIYYYRRDYEKAEEYCRRALEINPDFPFAHGHLENIYWRTGRHELAIDEMLTKADINSRSVIDEESEIISRDTLRTTYRDAYRKGGLVEFVRAYEKTNNDLAYSWRNPNTPFGYAAWYALMGEDEKALDNLEMALERRAFLMAWVKADPRFDSLRDEPRYQAILSRMHLAD